MKRGKNPGHEGSEACEAAPVEAGLACNQAASKAGGLGRSGFDLSKVEVNEGFREALALIQGAEKTAFITGGAGTGKSTLLRYLRAMSDKRVVVLAPTGLAAINVEGQTIHSFFKFPPRLIDTDKLKRMRGAEIFRRVEAVIVDEVSMVRADLMDGMDVALRLYRDRPDVPFGGVQMVFFGDLGQLPPIVREPEVKEYLTTHYGGIYFFHATAFQDMDLGCVELRKVYRQADASFVRLLDAIRRNEADDSVLEAINSRVREPGDLAYEEGLVTLTTTNDAACRRNEEYLAAIDRTLYVYHAAITDRFEESAWPTEAVLRLKVGAQVMMVRNDPDKRWVNGSIGRISGLDSDRVEVEIDGVSHEVERELWENIEYQVDRDKKKIEEKVVGTFTQFPLRLAWAITIHKSQGQTLRKVYVDLGWGAFTHGQTYVALSRCTSLNGLYLARPIAARDILFDDRVREFSRIFRK
jgi:hypothetical protein